MYVTVRDRPSAARPRSAGVAHRVAGTVVLLGIVSMLTDISSESVNAILPIYLTTILGMSTLAYGFIDGIYQGVSALVRILGGWIADRADHRNGLRSSVTSPRPSAGYFCSRRRRLPPSPRSSRSTGSARVYEPPPGTR